MAGQRAKVEDANELLNLCRRSRRQATKAERSPVHITTLHGRASGETHPRSGTSRSRTSALAAMYMSWLMAPTSVAPYPSVTLQSNVVPAPMAEVRQVRTGGGWGRELKGRELTVDQTHCRELRVGHKQALVATRP